ncbi:MAG: hypothetical protein HY329_09780, partial [Chloroflexi bacterium]|nr:hypothetical protein [Chloroflexota bacterium]
ADDIVISGEYSGYLLSAAAVAPGLPQVVRELLTIGTPTEMRRVPIPRELVGKRLAQLAAHLRQNNGSLLIGIITEDKGVSITDILTDDYSSIDEFIRRKFSEAGKGHLTSKLGSVRVIVNPSDDYEINDSDSAVVLSRERVAG